MTGYREFARYADERLPRYTSYPTAPHFSADISAQDYRAWLSALPATTPGSIYVHIPFCRSMCWYCGCHTTITQKDEPIAGYLAALHREVSVVADLPGAAIAITHVHFGGGTPTIVAPAAFDDLLRLLRTRFRIAADAEIAVEIDPRRLAPAMAATLANVGVTRASIGVQTFDPAVQQAINRVQSFEQTAAAVSALRMNGVRGINFDLIYGLPRQTVHSCIDTVEKCLELRPNRLSVFGYAHVPAFKKHQRKIIGAELPDAKARVDQAEAIAEMLTAAGYARIGFDHYALPGDPLQGALARGTLRRNFQGYTADSCQTLIGLGASAIGRLPQGYVQNETVIARYIDQVTQEGVATARGYGFATDDLLRAEIIERLMCDLKIDFGRVAAVHPAALDVLAQAMPQLEALSAEGIVHLDGSAIRVPEQARLLVRTVASVFDAYLMASNRAHSPAV
ncbi:MAG TPA: oxygen-independent coproporphyrinogen III oxidase [Pseudolabrys sp.]|nr:oxygen-independent coproporphyrinogen III oxidase [Pseudolabrys sp.]